MQRARIPWLAICWLVVIVPRESHGLVKRNVGVSSSASSYASSSSDGQGVQFRTAGVYTDPGGGYVSSSSSPGNSYAFKSIGGEGGTATGFASASVGERSTGTGCSVGCEGVGNGFGGGRLNSNYGSGYSGPAQYGNSGGLSGSLPSFGGGSTSYAGGYGSASASTGGGFSRPTSQSDFGYQPAGSYGGPQAPPRAGDTSVPSNVNNFKTPNYASTGPETSYDSPGVQSGLGGGFISVSNQPGKTYTYKFPDSGNNGYGQSSSGGFTGGSAYAGGYASAGGSAPSGSSYLSTKSGDYGLNSVPNGGKGGSYNVPGGGFVSLRTYPGGSYAGGSINSGSDTSVSTNALPTGGPYGSNPSVPYASSFSSYIPEQYDFPFAAQGFAGGFASAGPGGPSGPSWFGGSAHGPPGWPAHFPPFGGFGGGSFDPEGLQRHIEQQNRWIQQQIEEASKNAQPTGNGVLVRFGDSGSSASSSPDGGSHYGVSASSFQSSSNINGKEQRKGGSVVKVDNNGKVTTYVSKTP